MRKISEKHNVIILLLIITSLLITACGGYAEDTSSTTNSTAVQATENGTTLESDVADSKENAGTENAPAWELRPLNVINDKYRNYYEVFVYSFYDSDGDGIGDINGVTEKLSYIKDMGFNGIWLMPVMQSPTYHKYDVTDYYSIDKQYGSIEDFKNFIAEAHKNDISVIIDFVMNHTSSQHPWFTEACDYLKELPKEDERDIKELAEECPYVGYYHFSKEQLSGSYYPVEGTQFYYEGEFWSEMPDLDYTSKELRAEFEKIASFWLEMGVDGFRMDAVLHFEEQNTDFNTEVMNWLYAYAKDINPDFYMVSEVWASESTIAAYYASETDSMFNFDLADAEGKLIKTARGSLSAEKFVSAIKKYEDDFSSVYPEYIDAPFITNHDMGRVSNALNSDEAAVKYAGGLLLSLGGSPFVYYGEEIGMKSKGTKDENKRLSMLWSYTPDEGIKDKTGMTDGPGDADSDIESKFDGVKEQLEDEASILNYYKRALLIRNQNPEIARGKTEIIEEITEGNFAATVKEYDGSRIAILYNNSTDDIVYITQEQINIIKTKLNKKVDDKLEIAGFLTTDNDDIMLTNSELTLPARSIIYLK